MKRLFNINLRLNNSGGEKIRELEGTAAAFATHHRVILLVHGYNVSRVEAEKEFDAFESSISESAPQIVSDLGRVLWPGDSRVPVIRALSYPLRIKTAIQCAYDLGFYIHERKSPSGKPTDVVLIAHSLGCRLVLEALRFLFMLEHEGTRTIRVILMAAAVPVTYVHLRGNLNVARRRVSSFVLYSQSDFVLRFAFPPGQLLAEPQRPLIQEAIGLRGRPITGVWYARTEMYGYGHGDYWRSEDVQKQICKFLGFAVRTQLPSRVIAHHGSLNEGRSFPTHELRSRVIGVN